MNQVDVQTWGDVDQVLSVLQTVLDPELGINIVDLGLVYDIVVTGDQVDIDMTLTSPACPLSDRLTHEVTAAVFQHVPEISDVRVNFVWQPAWDPMMMSPAARSMLGW